MDMQSSRQLAVTRQQAWDALNDPDVLRLCIPGCDKLQATEPGRYVVSVAVKVGPVSARFNGKITLGDINAPTSYTLTFDAQGGAAGFGKGTAQVTLAPNDAGCELGYTVHAQVGGKLAQLGQRLVDGAAKSMAEDFFRRFDDQMQQRYPAAGAQAPAPEGAKAPGRSVPAWAWVAGAVVVLVVWWLAR